MTFAALMKLEEFLSYVILEKGTLEINFELR